VSFEAGHAALLVTALSFFLIGHLVLCAAGPKRARSLTEWTLTAMMVGAVCSVIASIAAVFLMGPLGLWTGRMLIGGPALAGLISMVFLPSMRLSNALAGPGGSGPVVGPRTRWNAPARILLLLLSAGIIFTATSAPVHLFDSVFHFGYKGRVMFTEGIGGAAWTDLEGPVGRLMTHPKYPPGVPALEVVTGWFLGHFDASAARGLLAIFALAPAVWICGALRARGRTVATLGAITWLAVPLLYYLKVPLGHSFHSVYGLLLGQDGAEPIFSNFLVAPDGKTDLTPARLHHMFVTRWSNPDGGGLDGSADLPLAACLFGALVHLWRMLPCVSLESDRTDWVVAMLMISGMLLMKNEGVAFFLLLALALFVAALLASGDQMLVTVKSLLPRIGPVFALALLLAAPWFIARAGIPNVDEDYPSQMSASNLVSVFSEPLEGKEKLGIHGYAPVIVGKQFFIALGNPLKWNLMWVLFGTTLLWSLVFARRRLGGDALLPLILVLLGTGMYFAILVVAPWDHGSLFKMGIPERLFLHIAPPAILATFAMLWRVEDEAA
jgi:hypothetical protein